MQRSIHTAATSADRNSHNIRQQEIFNNPDTLTFFTSPIPEDVQQVCVKISTLSSLRLNDWLLLQVQQIISLDPIGNFVF
jgi:hypothetical protein